MKKSPKQITLNNAKSAGGERAWKDLTEIEKKCLSKKYIEIIMDIGTQNRIIDNVKKRLTRLTTENSCPTKCEQKEIRALELCLKREECRRICYIKKCLQFLDENPRGPWNILQINCWSADMKVQ